YTLLDGSSLTIISDGQHFELTGEEPVTTIAASQAASEQLPDEATARDQPMGHPRKPENPKQQAIRDDDRSPVHRPPLMLDLLVFLCHSNKDKPAVPKLDRRLRNDGIQTWFAETALTGGEEWEPAIVKAVRRSDIVIVCLSQNAVAGSGYLQKELRTVLDVADEQPQESRFIIPVKLEDCNVPGRLAKWQWIDHYKRGGYQRLLTALHQALAESSRPKVPPWFDHCEATRGVPRVHMRWHWRCRSNSLHSRGWRPIAPIRIQTSNSCLMSLQSWPRLSCCSRRCLCSA
ncbi:MAG: toll/interleukin-1 receptor domain-containing protein, partial [Chloroflexota bacterium]|nr:toll/interleukin-1 receptor domain-containing protein [Chloroflexota bacterium]